MKKTSGILLTLLLGSQFALADAQNNVTYKIDGNRIDVTNAFWKSTASYKLSSIDSVIKSSGEKVTYEMRIDKNRYTIDKDIYEGILDYMEDSK